MKQNSDSEGVVKFYAFTVKCMFYALILYHKTNRKKNPWELKLKGVNFSLYAFVGLHFYTSSPSLLPSIYLSSSIRITFKNTYVGLGATVAQLVQGFPNVHGAMFVLHSTV